MASSDWSDHSAVYASNHRSYSTGEITRALCLPLYWKSLLYRACGGLRHSFVTLGSLTTTWNKLWDSCGVDDEPAQFVYLLRVKQEFLGSLGGAAMHDGMNLFISTHETRSHVATFPRASERGTYCHMRRFGHIHPTVEGVPIE